jgi:hypothetical protein
MRNEVLTTTIWWLRQPVTFADAHPDFLVAHALRQPSKRMGHTCPRPLSRLMHAYLVGQLRVCFKLVHQNSPRPAMARCRYGQASQFLPRWFEENSTIRQCIAPTKHPTWKEKINARARVSARVLGRGHGMALHLLLAKLVFFKCLGSRPPTHHHGHNTASAALSGSSRALPFFRPDTHKKHILRMPPSPPKTTNTAQPTARERRHHGLCSKQNPMPTPATADPPQSTHPHQGAMGMRGDKTVPRARAVTATPCQNQPVFLGAPKTQARCAPPHPGAQCLPSRGRSILLSLSAATTVEHSHSRTARC